MAKVTREMVQEIYERIDFINHGDDGITEGLTAAFAVAGRDLAGQLRNLAAAKRVSVEHLQGLRHPTCAQRLNEANGLDEAAELVERALGGGVDG